MVRRDEIVLAPAWSPLTRAPGRAAVLVDFDGSLAPIVDDPAAAAPLPAAVAALHRLAERLALVAVVSGRPVAFVRGHLPDPRMMVVGQYGLEVDRGDGVETDSRAAAFTDAVEAAAADASRQWPALTVERKGGLAVTIHWRRAPEHAPEPAALAALAATHGLVGMPGRLAYELRPPVPVDKGTAVASLLTTTDPATVAFAGDDLGDLAAFRALDDWAAAASGRARVRVAVASDEAPDALVAAADLVVAGPAALAAQLAALADAVS